MATIHEGGLGQRRVVDTARFEVGLADHDEVGVPGVACQQGRQLVERAGLAHRIERDLKPLGCGAG